MKAKEILAGLYTAAQCTDIADCNLVIDTIWERLRAIGDGLSTPSAFPLVSKRFQACYDKRESFCPNYCNRYVNGEIDGNGNEIASPSSESELVSSDMNKETEQPAAPAPAPKKDTTPKPVRFVLIARSGGAVAGFKSGSLRKAISAVNAEYDLTPKLQYNRVLRAFQETQLYADAHLVGETLDGRSSADVVPKSSYIVSLFYA
ncbi:hypothetical protein F0P96_04460 [Hymenobacter busanensis]|uniref:Uncharacterized protein n=1 Tax=Hymenobacter busanensis TaxID=2607656 RepID=A0A7L4ZTB6_9BACT|nr:hypothetical protein [Hymenobacter busanensis]KAA9339875.1 hypothetical protein F0P96_04460 [Hymenobacter busanensis]QHJ06368.1 hypothetical protein GUY19_03265 [Hymenobacter busanensis]